ncbi:MAG: hypothetical protein HKN01_03895, partial [Acidimicrobiia bacterium]|nr:hypothetical protein [Acidimicrobiia bacterium]
MHLALATVLAMALIAAAPLFAALPANDSFSYSVGDLGGNSGGNGWTGAWVGGTEIQVVTPGLTHPVGPLPVAGNAVELNLTVPLVPGQAVRDLDTSLGGVDETIWVSFLVKPQETELTDYLGITLGSAGDPVTPDPTRLFVGYYGTNFNLNSWGHTTQNVDVSGVVAGQTFFLVLELEILAAGNETATLYVNPTPGLAAPEPVTASADKVDLDLGIFTKITVGGGRGLVANPAQLDEIRIGRTYLSVAPVDSDGDGLWDHQEDANTDLDDDPSTNPGPDTDGDLLYNYLDTDDDDDGTPTAGENADPNSDGDPRDAHDSDRDAQPDYLDDPTGESAGTVASEQKISSLVGGLTGPLNNFDSFGRAASAIGDLDGDGINDMVVGAYADGDGGSGRGAVYVLFLNTNGTVKSEQKISDLQGNLTTPLGDNDWFGLSAAGIGDLDGDGLGDIVVSALNDDDGGAERGAVYVLLLNANGTVKSEQKISDVEGNFLTPLDDGDRFGSAVAGIGDLDGDGVNDIAVAAIADDDGGNARGAVYILFLNADGTVKNEQKISDLEGDFLTPLEDMDSFGSSVASLGDLDGDSTNDIAVGASVDGDGGTGRGAVYVLFLNSDGTVKGEQKISDLEGNFLEPLENDDKFGGAAAGVGDIDNDGVPDLLVGANGDDDGGSARGAAYVLLLNSNGTVKSERKISDLAGGLSAPLADADQFGVAVSGLGDLDGDGLIDVVVGAFGDDDGGSSRGAVYVLNLSGPSPVVDLDDNDSAASGLDFVATWTEGAGPVLIADSDAVITDADDTSLTGLTVEITNLLDTGEETLDADTSGTGLSKVWNAGSGQLVLSPPRPIGEYVQVLKTVVYNNTSSTPNTTARVISVTADDGTSTSAPAVTTLTMVSTSVVSGTVFEDIAGDVLSDGTIGDANNPGAVGVGVYVYEDTNSNTILNIGTDTLVAGPVATNGSGGYSVSGLEDGKDYFVQIDSKTVPSSQDPVAPQGDLWAEQTWAPAGTWCANGTGSSSQRVTAGPCYGALNGTFYDSASFPKHYTMVSPSGADISALDYGFSFNVVVNTRGGDGTDYDLGANRTVQGSLRQFIQNANAISGANVMRFVPAVPTDGTNGTETWWTIPVTVALPIVSGAATTVDGTAYDLANGTGLRSSNPLGPELELNGSGVTTVGVELQGGSSEVRGLTVNRFVSGIKLTGGGSNTVAGNYLGTDVTGALGLVGNTDEGILIDQSAGNMIGGTTAADRNIISGNRLRGINIDDVTDGAPVTSAGTQILGNYIGVDRTGLATVPYDGGPSYQQIGIYVVDTTDTTIGTPASGNVISGNFWYGIYVWGPNSAGNVIQNNIIGRDAAASGAVPNGAEGASRSGIYLSSSPGNLVGGSGPGEGNVIASNAHTGVLVQGAAAVDNPILGNDIFDNVDLGIDLDVIGVTGNDPGDGDGGPNDRMNFPEITSAVEQGGLVVVGFDLDTLAGDYRIEFFDNSTTDREGESYADFYNVVSHPGGLASYSTTIPGSVGSIITATATEEIAAPFGSTSEFSPTFSSISGPTITLPSGALNYTEGDPPTPLDAAATVTDPDSPDFAGGTLTVTIAINATGNDRLAINDEGPGAGNISLSGVNDVTYDDGVSGAQIIGSYSGGSGATPLVISLVAPANVTSTQALLRNITYENVVLLPATTPRTVSVQLTDGDGGTSNLASKAIDYSGLNTPLPHEYFVPIPDEQVRSWAVTVDDNTYPPSDDMRAVVSITVTLDGNRIVYDHWEDGLETNPSNPTQATTEIWGDGRAATGCPPTLNRLPLTCTNANDLFDAGDILALENDVPANPRGSAIRFDGGDLIASDELVAVTRAGWPLNVGTCPGPTCYSGVVLAGAVETYVTSEWGTEFTSPVGTNAPGQMFDYAAFSVMAGANDTMVSVDVDNDGTLEFNQTLARGESLLAPNVEIGGTVLASKKVQVDLLTGDIGSTYEARWFALAPVNRWSSEYYTPVGETDPSAPVKVFFYNPAASDITVEFETLSSSGSVVVPAGGLSEYTMPA